MRFLFVLFLLPAFALAEPNRSQSLFELTQLVEMNKAVKEHFPEEFSKALEEASQYPDDQQRVGDVFVELVYQVFTKNIAAAERAGDDAATAYLLSIEQLLRRVLEHGGKTPCSRFLAGEKGMKYAFRSVSYGDFDRSYAAIIALIADGLGREAKTLEATDDERREMLEYLSETEFSSAAQINRIIQERSDDCETLLKYFRVLLDAPGEVGVKLRAVTAADFAKVRFLLD